MSSFTYAVPVPWPVPYTAGDYILPHGAASWSNATPVVAAHAVAWPYYFPTPQAVDRVGVQLGTAQANAAAWLAAYADSGAGRPGALLHDWGEVSLASGSGDKLITISATLLGRLWLVVWMAAANPQATVSVRGTLATPVPQLALSAHSAHFPLYGVVSYPVGAAPATGPAVAPTSIANLVIPQFRAA